MPPPPPHTWVEFSLCLCGAAGIDLHSKEEAGHRRRRRAEPSTLLPDIHFSLRQTTKAAAAGKTLFEKVERERWKVAIFP